MPNTNFQTLHQMSGAINSFVKQATGRDNMQNIDMEHITVAQNHYYDDVDISGRVVSFNAGAAGIPLDKCLVQIEPVQEGAGDPSPDNVRPISGWTGAKVTRTGKNLLPQKKFQYTETQVRLGSETADEAYRTLKAGTYTLSLQANVSSTCYYRADNGGAVLIGQNGGTFTLSEDTFLVIYCYKSDSLSADDIIKWQLELGSTATAYEPYQGETYDIEFPTEAGTVYGGSLTVNDDGTGTLVVDRAEVDLGTLNWTQVQFAGITGYYTRAPLDIKPCANSAAVNAILSNFFTIRFNAISQNYGAVALRDNGWLYVNYADQPTGEMVYELATPLTYQLTPQEVKTLLGTNNVWADTGDIEVKFKNIKEFF